MAERAELGRMISTTEGSLETASGCFKVVAVTHNTRFEKGEALETDEVPLLTRAVHTC